VLILERVGVVEVLQDVVPQLYGEAGHAVVEEALQSVHLLAERRLVV
jgi:hypothetical protein